MLILWYKIYLIWSQKSTYYTIHFIFSDNLHICTADVKHYNSNSCNRADGVQMGAEDLYANYMKKASLLLCLPRKTIAIHGKKDW